jgi:hypothetical protein
MCNNHTAFSGNSFVMHRKTCWKTADSLGKIPTGFLLTENEKNQIVIGFL